MRAANGAVVYIKDVAQVHMGYAVQTNIVREDGKRSALLTVLKNGETSTLDIVDRRPRRWSRSLTAGLGNLKVTPLFDQSIFVRTSINEVVREACDCSGADGVDDPVVSWLVAVDADCLYFDSAVDCHVADYSERRWARRST